MARVRVQKTLKMYIGGKFIRSESGRISPVKGVDGLVMNACFASRKDLRNAIANNRSAQPAWAARTAYNRGQILYRLAEILDDRASTLPTTEADAFGATDRAVHYAGWSDKVTALLSSLNPVAATYINYSLVRPLGVVVMVPHVDDRLLGIVEVACRSAVMGNGCTILVPLERAELAAQFCECLGTSDFPAGVINMLSGDIDALLQTANIHDDLDGLVLTEGTVSDKTLTAAQSEGARVMRRILTIARASEPAGPNELGRLSETQTVWMSAFEPRGGAAAY